MPVDQGLRLSHDGDILERDRSTGGTCVAKMAETCKRALVRRIARGRDVDREQGGLAFESEENPRRVRRHQTFGETGAEEAGLDAVGSLRRAEQEGLQAPERPDQGLRVLAF